MHVLFSDNATHELKLACVPRKKERSVFLFVTQICGSHLFLRLFISLSVCWRKVQWILVPGHTLGVYDCFGSFQRAHVRRTSVISEMYLSLCACGTTVQWLVTLSSFKDYFTAQTCVVGAMFVFPFTLTTLKSPWNAEKLWFKELRYERNNLLALNMELIILSCVETLRYFTYRIMLFSET